VRALINTVIVLGLGDVVRKRILPALAQLLRDGLLYRVVFLDIHVECPFALAEVPSPAGGVEYLQVTDNILPLDELKLGPQALVVIATPCRLHASYAKQCLGTGCRVAVEKPLTKSLAWGQSLLPFGHLLFAMDHFLFKLKMLPHWQEPGMEGEVA